MIEKLLNDKDFQDKIIALKYAEFKSFTYKDKNNQEYQELKLVIKNYSSLRNYIIPKFSEYMEDRKISIKGLSKPIQLKVEGFLDNFNKTNISPIKEHKFKLTYSYNSGSFTTDSSIKIYSKEQIKIIYKSRINSNKKTKKLRKKVQYFVNIW